MLVPSLLRCLSTHPRLSARQDFVLQIHTQADLASPFLKEVCFKFFSGSRVRVGQGRGGLNNLSWFLLSWDRDLFPLGDAPLSPIPQEAL